MFTILGADGKEYGPVSAGRIAEWIAGGRANLQTQARRSGEQEWKTLGDFVEFNPAATPPPLPEAAVPPALTAPVVPEVAAAPADHLVLAGLGQRFGAALVEGILQTLCKLPMILAMFQLFAEVAKDPEGVKPDEFSGIILEGYSQSIPYLGLYVLIQVTLLCFRSQSIGKLLFGMRIVDVQTGEPGGPLRAFLLRGFLTTMIEMIPLLGFVFWIVDNACIFREDRRCLHDLIAGTKVVKV